MQNAVLLPPEAYDSFIGTLDPHVLVEIMKSDYRMSERVFQGFRANPQALKSAIIRQRIGREFERSPELLGLLLDLWAELHEPILEFVSNRTRAEIVDSLTGMARMFGGINLYLSLSLDSRTGVRKLAEKRGAELFDIKASPDAAPAKAPRKQEEADPDSAVKIRKDLKTAKDKAAQLAKDKRALERELKTAEQAAAKAGKRAELSRADVLDMKTARDEASRKADRAVRERKQAEEKVADLERTVRDLRRALDMQESDERIDKSVQDAPWQYAVERMLKTKKYESAIDFLVFIAERTNHNPTPHEYLVQAYRGSKQADLQVSELKWLGRQYLAQGRVGAAADRLCRALAVGEDSTSVKKLLKEVFERVDGRNEKRMSELRRTMLRFRAAHLQVYDEAIQLARAVSPYLAATLETVKAAVHVDRMFTLQSRSQVRIMSPRQIMEAVNGNDLKTVQFLKGALKALKRGNLDEFQAIMDVIRQEDSSCCVPLVADTEPVIVDASNAAYHLTTSDGKPRLRNITNLRQALRRNGYYPVFLYADAALPYQIDRSSELNEMAESGQLELVDSGTDADETIVNQAKRIGCPVVTRDAMLDWDPERVVTKLRFDLGDDWAEIIE